MFYIMQKSSLFCQNLVGMYLRHPPPPPPPPPPFSEHVLFFSHPNITFLFLNINPNNFSIAFDFQLIMLQILFLYFLVANLMEICQYFCLCQT